MYKINENYFNEFIDICKAFEYSPMLDSKVLDDMIKNAEDNRKQSSANIGKNPSVIDNQETKTVITTDLPGYKKEGIKITTTSKVLSVSVEGVRGKKTYNYTLTDIADYQKISSKFEDGVLTIEVPNKAEATPVEIKVW